MSSFIACRPLWYYRGPLSTVRPIRRSLLNVETKRNPILHRQSVSLSDSSSVTRPTASHQHAKQSATAAHRRSISWQEQADEFLRKPRTLPIPRWISPQHYTFTITECFGHSSFILVAISYAVDDFLMLRILAVAGSTVMLVFTYFHPYGRVLWLPFKWNVLFIVLNSYRIGKIYLDRYMAEQLPEELLRIRRDHFYVVSPVAFAKLARLGHRETFEDGEVLVSQVRTPCFDSVAVVGTNFD